MSSPPRAKRPRIPKDFRACRSCVSSKVRCEDFIPSHGCKRCRRRDERCSFVDEPPHVLPLGHGSGQPNGHGHGHGHGHGGEGSPSSSSAGAASRAYTGMNGGGGGSEREGYLKLEERIKDLETRLHARRPSHSHSHARAHGQPAAYASPDSPAYPTPTPPSASHGSTPLASAAAAGNDTRGRRRRHEIQLSSIFLRRNDERKLRWQHRFDETTYALVDPAGYPDVVEDGLVSSEQMDMYYHALVPPFFTSRTIASLRSAQLTPVSKHV